MTLPETVVLRADADATLGAGHVMRCLALARAFMDAGMQPVLATTCRDAGVLATLRNAQVGVESLSGRHPDPSDARQVERLLRRHEAAALVVDGYHFDNTFLDAVRPASVCALVIDDAPRLPQYDCDILLDVNLGALRQAYPLARGRKAMLGARFTLLRPQFLEAARAAEPADRAASRLLVTMGASDPPDATSLVLRALARDARAWDVTVVVGSANPHLGAVQAAASALPRVRILRNVERLDQLMSASDLAIGAVGGTMWELAHIGVPTLLLSASELHDRVAAAADAYGSHAWIGNVGAQNEDTIVEAVRALAHDAARRAEMSRLGRLLIDGGGAARVAAAMRGGKPDWCIRPAAAADAEAIWEMTRENQVSAAASFGSFERRFIRDLGDDGRRTWVSDCGGSVVAFVQYSSPIAPVVALAGVADAYRTHDVLDELVAATREKATAAMIR